MHFSNPSGELCEIQAGWAENVDDMSFATENCGDLTRAEA